MRTIARFTLIRIFALLVMLGGTSFVVNTVLSQQSSGWPQWGHDPQHTGTVNVAGQNLNTILANIVYDPFVDQEKAPQNGDGDLLVHYQTPLVDGNDVYMYVRLSVTKPDSGGDQIGGRFLLRIGPRPLLLERLPEPSRIDDTQVRHIALGPDGHLYRMQIDKDGVRIYRR